MRRTVKGRAQERSSIDPVPSLRDAPQVPAAA